MPTDFSLRLDVESSGAPVAVEGWSTHVLNPAVVIVEAAAKGRDVVLTLDVGKAGQLRVLGVEVRGTVAVPVVTSDSLRGFRLPQLVRAAQIFLRTNHDGGQSRATISLFSLDDLNSSAWKPSDFYPPLVITRSGMQAEPEWLARLKTAGPRSDRGTKTIAALFELAAEIDQEPNAFIQRTLDMNSATASRWVQAARDAGLVTVPPRRGQK